MLTPCLVPATDTWTLVPGGAVEQAAVPGAPQEQQEHPDPAKGLGLFQGDGPAGCSWPTPVKQQTNQVSLEDKVAAW